VHTLDIQFEEMDSASNNSTVSDPPCEFQDPVTKKKYFIVEKVLKSRQSIVKDQIQTEYLVKWLNYPDSDNTWEPLENNLPYCYNVLQDFYNNRFLRQNKYYS